MKKNIILSMQRSGTTYLVTMLDRNKDILSVGEIFKHNNIINHPEFWYDGACSIEQHLDKLYSRHEKIIIFKLMLNQIQKYPRVLDYLYLNDAGCIYVERKNLLKIHLSHVQAKNTGVWASSNKTSNYDKKRFKIDTENLHESLVALEKQQLALREIFNNFKNRIIVYYEDLMTNKENTFISIYNFLNIDQYLFAEDTTKKISSNNLSHEIVNYDDVYTLLSKTKFKLFLEDA